MASLVLTTMVVGCHRTEDTPVPIRTGSLPAPAPDDSGDLCLDVGEGRACFGRPMADASCVEGVCRVPRTLPAGPAPPAGFRCGGQGAGRTCVSRAVDGGPFRCEGERCVQSPLRVPDSGEWECVELSGALVCRDLADAAGVERGPLDPAFVCGARRGSAERVCVDLAPDRPPVSGAWTCRVRYAGGRAERECVPSRTTSLGGDCRGPTACPDGALCVSGLCLPPRPEPTCWFDQDCGRAARCRFGTCRAEG